jgi:hypothetical protein
MTTIVNGERRYGVWGRRPRRQPVDPTRCIAEVFHRLTTIPCQCSRKRGHGPDGLFCKQHAKQHEVTK